MLKISILAIVNVGAEHSTTSTIRAIRGTKANLALPQIIKSRRIVRHVLSNHYVGVKSSANRELGLKSRSS
jgi:hypothetical protein